jgi:hypothetical protein
VGGGKRRERDTHGIEAHPWWTLMDGDRDRSTPMAPMAGRCEVRRAKGEGGRWKDEGRNEAEVDWRRD